MKLHQLLEGLPTGLISPEFALSTAGGEVEVKGICTNSHACQKGDLFIGMPGTRVDGGEFWPSAMEAGAVAALVSAQALQNRPVEGIACVVPMTDMALACAAVAGE